MRSHENKVTYIIKSFIGRVNRVAGVSRGEQELAAERAVYAEIGRIVGVPFSVANV